MDIEPPFVLAKGLIPSLVFQYKITDGLAQISVFGRRAIKLVGECAKEAVAVAEGVGGVEAEGAELLGEVCGGLGNVGEEAGLLGACCAAPGCEKSME